MKYQRRAHRVTGVTTSAENDRLKAMNYLTDPDPELK